MKVKDLIKALQACDPETFVEVNIERCDEVRFDVIKKCLRDNTTSPIQQMSIDGVFLEEGIQGEDENTVSCILQAKANV